MVHCKLTPKSETLREELYATYCEVCSAGGQKPVSQIRFNKELEQVDGISRGLDSVTRRKTWVGIQLS